MSRKVQFKLNLDITVTLRESFPKSHGLDRNNWNYYNSIVRLAINGLELPKKCQREVITT